ncbi:MAG: MscL family protein [Candidatus Woesearchaeota archaeon]|jgi:large conductance mechanosensitive channel|nr:MscL family protein [Candidatus Woesearchaeota archaeon]MDP7198474.1 MscL family protein [Candidatus Woesearchaeota archaeon]MDP7466784.1 MscL family protein [Candidatus Woesearchaeota archaeon]MDP7648009.1 MscL family protein [Candidatus Woesearchaeota archaeon]|tara:strand:+ start:1033 stop:1353 length:321 start_codon:yes stop_codon:yes gene_type:complete
MRAKVIAVRDEFKEFLNQYAIIGMAMGFVMGAASKDLMKSLVTNIIMPIITPFVPEGGWATSQLVIGPFVFKWGPFVAELLNFLILAVLVFIIAKKVLKMEKVGKK